MPARRSAGEIGAKAGCRPTRHSHDTRPSFIPHAKREFLLEKYGLTAKGIVRTVLNEFKNMNYHKEKAN